MADTIAEPERPEKESMSVRSDPQNGSFRTVVPPAAPIPADVQAALARLAGAPMVPPALAAALAGPLRDPIASTAEPARAALSDATKRAYTRDWFAFAEWCRAQLVDPTALPIHPVLVAAYLASLAGRLGQSALKVRLAAIAHEHRRRGVEWDAGHPAIRATLQSVARQHGKPIKPAAALSSADIKRLVGTCVDDTAGLRDRALLLVGFAAALRRSELVAIDFVDLRFEAEHVAIRIKRATGDRDDLVALPRMRDDAGGVSATCPVQALERWLVRAHIRRGPVFRSVTSGGRLGDRLSGDGVRQILLRRAGLAGIAAPPGERLSPLGLRAGRAAEARRVDLARLLDL